MAGPANDESSSNKRARLGHDAVGDKRHVTLKGGDALPAGIIKRWREAELCDISVRAVGVAETRTFAAHRLALAEGSDYFSSLFGQRDGAFSDSGSKVIDLPHMEPDVFSWVLEFLYCGTVEIPVANLSQVLEVSARLQVASLMSAATKTTGESITSEICLELWDLAERLNLGELEDIAKMVALCDLQAIAFQDGFQALPLAKLKFLLASDELLIESEEDLYTTVMNRWVDKQQPEPAQDGLLDLLRLFRYPLMKRDFVDAILQKANEEGNNEFCTLICESYMACYYDKRPSHRGIKWFIPDEYTDSVKERLKITEDEAEIQKQCLVPLRRMFHQGSGKWDIAIKLLSDDSEMEDAVSAFGFINESALQDVGKGMANDKKFLSTKLMFEELQGLWMLRRFQGTVYSDGRQVGVVDDDFIFPVEADIRMQIDTDACTAKFFVGEAPVPHGQVTGIRMPVWPFVMNYKTSGTPVVKVRLVQIGST